jgi:hypothetical protein
VNPTGWSRGQYSPAVEIGEVPHRNGRSAFGHVLPATPAAEYGIGDLEHFWDGRVRLRPQRTVTWRDQVAERTVGFRSIAEARRWPSSRVSARPGGTR